MLSERERRILKGKCARCGTRAPRAGKSECAACAQKQIGRTPSAAPAPDDGIYVESYVSDGLRVWRVDSVKAGRRSNRALNHPASDAFNYGQRLAGWVK